MTDATLLLDTNAVVAVLRSRPLIVRERLERAWNAGRMVAVSSLTMLELWYGVARSTRPDVSAQQLRELLAGGIGVVVFDGEDGEVAGALRAHLERAGTPIGPYDLLIAAQARRLGCTLVTASVGEFSRVPELIWENWLAPA